MTFFRVSAYLLPLVSALAVTAVLSDGRLKNRRGFRTAGGAGAAFAIPAGALFAGWVFSSEPFGRFGGAVVLSAAFAAGAAGLFLFLSGLRLPAPAAQLLCSLAATGLTVSVFALGPVIRNARETGMSGDALVERIDLVLSLSPYPVLGYSLFGDDVLRHPILYATDAADYPFSVPSWPVYALRCALTGLVLASLGLALQRRGRNPEEAPAP